MPVERVAISIEPTLLARIDAEAAGAGQSRSAFIASSLRDALEKREEERTLREARACYAEIEADDELRRLHERAEAIVQETLPPYGPAAGDLPDTPDVTGTGDTNQEAVA